MARLQIDLNDQEMQALDILMKEVGISVKKDLFNNALTLLSWAVDELKVGKKIASVNEEGKRYQELQMPIFRNVKVAYNTQAPRSASASYG